MGGGLQQERLGDPEPQDLHHLVRRGFFHPGLQGRVDGAQMAQRGHHQGAGEGAVAGGKRGQRRVVEALVHAGAAPQGGGQQVQRRGAGRQAGDVGGRVRRG